MTGAGTTTMSNRNIYQSTAAATGLFLYFVAQAVVAYVQASGATKPADVSSNGATPATYTLMTTSPQLYDNTGVATSGTGPNGSMVNVVLGVDHTFVGGPGNATALPSLILQYDEA